MNQVSLIGRLTADPEVSTVGEDNTALCKMRIAVDRRDDNVDFFDIETWGKGAEACGEYLAKGRKVGVTGELRYNAWEAEDGSKRSKVFVRGNVEFLDYKKPDEDEAKTAEAVAA